MSIGTAPRRRATQRHRHPQQDRALAVRYGIGIDKHDREGRVLSAEFDHYHLVTVYTPNSQNHDENKRLVAWTTAPANGRSISSPTYSAEAEKPVICCGGLNVAHREIDLANPKTNRKNAGFTDEERARFDALLEAGFIDSYRALYPERRDAYTWWSYRAGARARNIGWRIDYFCVSNCLREQIADARILQNVTGSDHCPVGLQLKTLSPFTTDPQAAIGSLGEVELIRRIRVWLGTQLRPPRPPVWAMTAPCSRPAPADRCY